MGKAAKSASNKPRAKSELFRELSEVAGVTRKQVAQIFEGMTSIIKKDLTRGPGVFAVPGLMKITVIRKPATKAVTKPSPFNPGEMMTVKAKPARKVVKVRALKGLKSMV
ncbi:MAG: HU family DNA-binding protein [Phycisphaerales bacterium]|nr:HU family DNA-binding protein [Phycisphaerales bacterium]